MKDSIHEKKPGKSGQDEDSVTLPARPERNLTTGKGAAGKKGKRRQRDLSRNGFTSQKRAVSKNYHR
ncbi:MAG: hypothetical protein ABGY96_28640 [bacterium]|nr:hypothetical protein [Gammaproteobacteria bacterium]HIL96639.1 hypothetical protein [Pseudomonadales bacterium]